MHISRFFNTKRRNNFLLAMYMPRQIKEGILRRYRMYLQYSPEKKLRKNRVLWSILDEYIRNSGSTGCSYSDYLILYNYIRDHKPKEILECGTGISTVVMAYAMLENEMDGAPRGRITSMEELEKYYLLAQKLLPQSLKKYVEIVLSPTVEDYYLLFRGMRYKNIPQRSYDFVFIDGPKTMSPLDNARLCDLDFIWVVEKSEKPVFAIVDKRVSTCFVLQKVFGRNIVRFDYEHRVGLIGPCSKKDLRRSTGEITDEIMEEGAFSRSSALIALFGKTKFY